MTKQEACVRRLWSVNVTQIVLQKYMAAMTYLCSLDSFLPDATEETTDAGGHRSSRRSCTLLLWMQRGSLLTEPKPTLLCGLGGWSHGLWRLLPGRLLLLLWRWRAGHFLGSR